MKSNPLGNHGDPQLTSRPTLPVEVRPSGKASPQDGDSKTESEFIYVDGAMVPFATAALQVSNIAAGNGASVFEGMCVYSNARGQCFLFRLKEHLASLRDSARQMQIDCDYTDEDFVDAILMSVRGNRIQGDAHIRLSLFITGNGGKDARKPVSLVCTARARTSVEIQNRVVHAAISSWRRVEDPLMAPRLKAEANHHNSRFGLLEVLRNGYDQAIFLTKARKVSCGANASFLMVRNDCVICPPATSDAVEAVTRSTLLELAAEDLGLSVQEREIDRSELSYADEALFCGSGLEIRPVISINKIRISGGQVGPVTRRLWNAYEAAVRGWNRDRFAWLTPLGLEQDAVEQQPKPIKEPSRVAQIRARVESNSFPVRSGQIAELFKNGYLMGSASSM